MEPFHRGPRRASDDPALGNLIAETSELNDSFEHASESVGRAAGLSYARWQVLAEVAAQPLTVAQAARRLNLTRQSVQRTTDLLVAGGFLALLANPDHQRARLLSPTHAGRLALDIAAQSQVRWTRRLAQRVETEAVQAAVELMRQIRAELDAIETDLALPDAPSGEPDADQPQSEEAT